MALIVGGTVGALLRYALATTWPHPHQMLVSTVLTVGAAFTIAAFVLATNSASLFANLILGFCASAASLSAWAVLTISQPMKLSLAFLIATPAAAIGGLLCGLAVARAVAR
ncbi:chromosome condensation protein CrcB [Mycolicibacterium iranicum]|uniref:chromosome condensation protein CrcB n=1 Tax=Mycolicibacterium iranicum TaxID=912594 RepID=UPI000ABF5C97|nr:chromosome condensation protein CrcB [Mycolicibacterium iranicum]